MQSPMPSILKKYQALFLLNEYFASFKWFYQWEKKLQTQSKTSLLFSEYKRSVAYDAPIYSRQKTGKIPICINNRVFMMAYNTQRLSQVD